MTLARFFADVIDSNTQMQNLVSFSQFSIDLTNDALPNFSFTVPNLQDDAHDGRCRRRTHGSRQILRRWFRMQRFVVMDC